MNRRIGPMQQHERWPVRLPSSRICSLPRFQRREMICRCDICRTGRRSNPRKSENLSQKHNEQSHKQARSEPKIRTMLFPLFFKGCPSSGRTASAFSPVRETGNVSSNRQTISVSLPMSRNTCGWSKASKRRCTQTRARTKIHSQPLIIAEFEKLRLCHARPRSDNLI